AEAHVAASVVADPFARGLTGRPPTRRGGQAVAGSRVSPRVRAHPTRPCRPNRHFSMISYKPVSKIDLPRFHPAPRCAKLPGKQPLGAFAIAAATIASLVIGARCAPAHTPDWPTRPLTRVAPFGAGGSTDAIARIVADGLGGELHQPVIVENIGGAGGMIGANRVAKAVPDGYQFVLGNVGTHAQNQW